MLAIAASSFLFISLLGCVSGLPDLDRDDDCANGSHHSSERVDVHFTPSAKREPCCPTTGDGPCLDRLLVLAEQSFRVGPFGRSA